MDSLLACVGSFPKPPFHSLNSKPTRTSKQQRAATARSRRPGEGSQAEPCPGKRNPRSPMLSCLDKHGVVQNGFGLILGLHLPPFAWGFAQKGIDSVGGVLLGLMTLRINLGQSWVTPRKKLLLLVERDIEGKPEKATRFQGKRTWARSCLTNLEVVQNLPAHFRDWQC